MPARMPSAQEKSWLHTRDGYHCRFCGIPVIRPEIREKIRRVYPRALRWGKRNAERHAAFFALWAQYDHLLPHAKGGSNELSNLVVTCAACNYGRGGYTLGEMGLCNPLDRPPIQSPWDGLGAFRSGHSALGVKIPSNASGICVGSSQIKSLLPNQRRDRLPHLRRIRHASPDPACAARF